MSLPLLTIAFAILLVAGANSSTMTFDPVCLTPLTSDAASVLSSSCPCPSLGGATGESAEVSTGESAEVSSGEVAVGVGLPRAIMQGKDS